MSGCNAKNTISELVLAAVFYLQQKNGVSVMEIAEYIGEKKCCNPCKIRGPIKIVLNKAKEHGIMSESKGRYRIEGKYEDALIKEELKPSKNQEDEDDGNGNGKDDVCVAFDHEGDGKGHDHDHGAGENPTDAGPGTPEDCLRDGAEEDEEDGEDEDEDEDDDCKDRDLGEPLSKKRRTSGKVRGAYDFSQEEEDEDWGRCILEELRYLDKPK